MKSIGKKSPAGIQYVGEAGITEECKQAIMRLLQYGDEITLARVLSSPGKHHGFLLTINTGDLVAVKSGFASGYLGEGSRGFSFVLQLLDAHEIEIEEFEVSEEILERLDMSSLTNGDLEIIEAACRVRPVRIYEYIFEKHFEQEKARTLWQEFPPVVPLAIIDNRIIDLALNFFQNPDDNLLKGYRRLEDIVRKRTEINEYGHGLFSKAFHGEQPKLYWKELNSAEQIGRANLFTGTYMAYRNPRAHKELEHDSCGQLTEFLLLNHLFILEKSAIEVDDDSQQPAKTRKRPY